ncbi:tryptophan 2,3-dioxygenase [bacterium (Candidatus Blackallbacteria) CG17_big_fil_post_rev_8_21_14_2_50_48_46]|uniref:Tryptophan 2,3-dioxygenase n=1 Tax=bacterium (Candidatus Blackallbacteria) CG17_big_fil_post_rev_8_21_14_2_50_48_46 TaxID=2014261 RepID=A0A2M7G3D0_9BACT|nr:MAG: tryptophan 2,3-dioxygenase [bacterium (Candidatus Blackallbacteria) CG18_big_fil_WC_8_21_14_2_50_49_26]PIW16340.1 MAG: tryptophan 2,3-dioxygenase [bacterium (Candidatus Blackallbacteria) CG17_big_fil_post_rev_8_21_14_2_50_48_46]PIW45354.1 MAG: tryptophan 2,3-dioxygenase [bacterium (Candidatus Blackallbacteria) CG13_big_fil_rev_8_21_14_2_50_49_14]
MAEQNASSPVYYADYLKLDKILDAQKPLSNLEGQAAHDEMLFIIIHQAYELWFKQVLHELDSVMAFFRQPTVSEDQMGIAVARLERIIEIQRLMLMQMQVLQTMQPLDFLDFRDQLYPASGFQSYQFRILENRLGLKPEQRVPYHQGRYDASLDARHQNLLKTAESEPSLLELVEKWLERTPFLTFGGFDFWESYRQAVEALFDGDAARISSNPLLGSEDIQQHLARLHSTRETFATLFSEAQYQELQHKGERRLSYKATKAALLILLYRERPILHLPYRLLNALSTIDELLTTWRYRHALNVQRMIGTKVGTGGSMGFEYLLQTMASHRIFGDFNQLSTFMIPRSALPDLPTEIERQLGFFYQGEPV